MVKTRVTAIWHRLAIACAWLALGALSIFAQRDAAPVPGLQAPAPLPLLDGGRGLIHLDVVVTDASGNPVPNLSRSDFKLLDNGTPQKLLSFQAFDEVSKADPPPRVILVVDTLALPDRVVHDEQVAVETFLRQKGGHLAQPVSLYSLSSSSFAAVDYPSTDGNKLASDLAHAQNQRPLRSFVSAARGRTWTWLNVDDTPGFEALKAMGQIATLERQQPGRKLLVWVGPGWGLGTGAQPGGATSREDVFYTIRWFSSLLREARISLFSLSVAETQPSQLYLAYRNGVRSAKQASFMNLYRKVLAEQTGGRVLDSSFDIVRQIESCLHGLNTYYTLSFDPPPSTQQNDYHDLSIQIGKPGLKARTNTGYYDQPYFSDQPSQAARSISSEQLGQLLGKLRNESDAKAVRELAGLVLTDRPGASTALAWRASVHGKNSLQLLNAIIDASAFRGPSPSTVSADPAPSAADQQSIVTQAAQYLANTIPRLPNFYARRTTVRYQDVPIVNETGTVIGYQAPRVAQTAEETILYRDGKEIVDAGAPAHGKQKIADGILITYGTFGPILRLAQDALATQTSLTWVRWEQDAVNKRAVFRFAVPVSKSRYNVSGCCLPEGNGTSGFNVIAPYHGEISIDPATGAVVRLEAVADLGPFVPLDRSDIVVEYGPVEIGGQTYICPMKSVSIMRSRAVVTFSDWDESFRTFGPYATTMNDMMFDTYHVFRADSRMLAGFTPPENQGNAQLPQEATVASAQAAESDTQRKEEQGGASPAESKPPADFRDSLVSAGNTLLLETPRVGDLVPLAEGPAEQTFTIVRNINRAIVPVVVRDKRGQVITGLTKEDFHVFDNGKLQVVAGLIVSKREVAKTGPQTDSGRGPAQADSLPTRITLYLFDDLHLNPEDLAYLKKIDAGALSGALTGTDMAAVASTSGKVNSGLTRDRAKLHDAIMSLEPRSIFTSSAGDCPKIGYYQADLIENKHDGAAFGNALAQVFACNPGLDRQRDMAIAQGMVESAARSFLMIGDHDAQVTLAAIKEYLGRMAKLPGQHTLVLVSPGFLSIAPESLHAESQIMDLAAESNVTINALDARGLYAGVTDIGESGGSQIIDPIHFAAMTRAGSVLAELADGTGGTFFHNNNDLAKGLGTVTDAPEVVYLLELSLDGVKPDGSYHRLEVKVDREGAQVKARKGYAAPQKEKGRK